MAHTKRTLWPAFSAPYTSGSFRTYSPATSFPRPGGNSPPGNTGNPSYTFISVPQPNLKPFARNAITIPQSNVTSRKGDTSLSFLTSNLVLSLTIWPICPRTRSQRQTKYINGQRALPAVFDHPWCRSTFRPISVQRILRKSKLFQYSFIYSATKV